MSFYLPRLTSSIQLLIQLQLQNQKLSSIYSSYRARVKTKLFKKQPEHLENTLCRGQHSQGQLTSLRTTSRNACSQEPADTEPPERENRRRHAPVPGWCMPNQNLSVRGTGGRAGGGPVFGKQQFAAILEVVTNVVRGAHEAAGMEFHCHLSQSSIQCLRLLTDI